MDAPRQPDDEWYCEAREADLLFVGAQGATLRPGNLRYRVMIPAAERAGVPWARFHALRHTCAALLIDAGVGPLRLQRWMGRHSAAFRSTTTPTPSTTASPRRWISATGSLAPAPAERQPVA